MSKENTNKIGNSKFKVRQSPFIDYLKKLSDSKQRGALAAMRRGLQHELGKCVDMYPYVIPWLKNIKGRWNKNMHYLIASLFAYHPNSGNSGNMGDVFRKISLAQGESKSVEQRFITLLRCNPDDLDFHMRQAISLAKSANIPIDWHRLFYDLKRWPYESSFPPYENWAQSFWKKEENNNNKKEKNKN